jgi:hypothetical protein
MIKGEGMSAITRIQLRIVTGDREDAGTDGNVLLGLAGREFNVDSSGVNDFERGSDRTYIFGDGSNVLRPGQNDPRSPWQLDTEDIPRCPRYIRFELGSGGDWNIELLELVVNPTPAGGGIIFRRLVGANNNLWLGAGQGKFIWFQ